MPKEQIKEQLEQMKGYVKNMKEEKVEASAFHEENSEFMIDLDLHILLASQTVKDLNRQLSR